MRAALLVVLLAAAACGPADGECTVDSECGGDVCARNGECLPASSVRVVRITWTVRGQPASATSCAQSPSLYVSFYGFSMSDTFGFEPVPCEAGVFTIDKLPDRFGSVELGERGSFQLVRPIDAQGNVAFDLMP